MNKLEKKKILNFLTKNSEEFSFTRIKQIDMVKKIKALRYMEDKEIAHTIIDFYFEENISDLESQKLKIKKIKSTTAKIKHLLQYQLELDFEKKDFLKKVFLFLSSEKKFPQIVDYFFRTSSQMWVLAGDTATDINYYSKRLILSSVYSQVFIKLMSFPNYQKIMIEKDIDASLSNVRKFNDIKSKICSADILSVFKKFQSSSESTGRGF